MSDQNTPSIKAVVPDSEGVQKNSAHVDSITFIQVDESEDESKTQIEEEK